VKDFLIAIMQANKGHRSGGGDVRNWVGWERELYGGGKACSPFFMRTFRQILGRSALAKISFAFCAQMRKITPLWKK
jgi:hypothetical protein